MTKLLARPSPEAMLVEELPATITAWDVCRQIADWPHLVFLDSAQSAPRGRYSFVTADPFDWISLPAKGRADFREGPEDAHVQSGPSRGSAHLSPFAVLEEKLAEFSQETLPSLPPFQGGAAGMLGYDLCQHLERLPRPCFDDFGVPDLAFGLYDWVASFDHHLQRGWLISTGFPEKDSARRRTRARRRLEEVKRRLGNITKVSRDAPAERGTALRWRVAANPIAGPHYPVQGRDGVYSNFEPGQYLQAVRRAIEYVHAGDCFQVNLAQRLMMRASLPPLVLYDRLRRRNPAPFAGYFDMGEFVIASASPEQFLHLRNGEVETRPIKGTRPRSRSLVEDRAGALQLQASAKDRAENVMIVDLLRNDLGRVCRYGSVRVETLCRLESFAYVHHLVSEVRGTLREGLKAIDLLRATFPGGSVTGAPKIRAMEIITELEQVSRGPYCGCLGYIGFDGTMDMNLLIRTFTIGKGWMQFPVGGGIVADSVAENEYAETWHKAQGMLAVTE